MVVKNVGQCQQAGHFCRGQCLVYFICDLSAVHSNVPRSESGSFVSPFFHTSTLVQKVIDRCFGHDDDDDDADDASFGSGYKKKEAVSLCFC